MIPVNIPPHVERIKINAHLAEVRDLPLDPQEELTGWIATWLEEFTDALKTNAPVEPIIERFRAKLLPFLQEHITPEFVASIPDTYDARPLRLFLDLLLNPNAPMFDQKIEEAYGFLRRQILSPTEQKVHNMIVRLQEEDAEVAEIEQEFAMLAQEIGDAFAQLRVEDQAAFARDEQAVEALEARDRERAEILDNAIRQHDQDINELNARIDELTENLEKTKDRIDETERANLQVQRAILEAERARKKSSRSWIQGVGMLALSVGFSWAASFFVKGLFATMGPAFKNAIPGLMQQPQATWIKYTVCKF